MNKKSFAKTALILLGTSLLFGCKANSMMGITMEEATARVNAAVTEQNDFKVELTKYSFSSTLVEYTADGWNNKRNLKSSKVEVHYTAPYRIDDEKTQYSLEYSSYTSYAYDEDVSKEISVKREEGKYIVNDGNETHQYSPTADSSLANFINLPSLISSNNIETLALCSQWISSIGTPTTPNKTNVLTSFEALGDKEGNFALTFTGDSLPINQIYADENTLPVGAVITSLTVNCSNNRVDSYSSKYNFIETIEALGIVEEEIQGEISVSFSYGA